MVKSITITRDGKPDYPWQLRWPEYPYGVERANYYFAAFKDALNEADFVRKNKEGCSELDILVIDEDGTFIIEDDVTKMTALLTFE